MRSHIIFAAFILIASCGWGGEATPNVPATSPTSTPTEVKTDPATAAVAPAAPVATNDPTYRLFVGDMLRIEVYDNPDLFRWLRVPAGGVVTYPLIGDLKGLVGRTIEDLSTDIQRRLEAD